MSDYKNPFLPQDTDRYAIWQMLVHRDIEAFVGLDWEAIHNDFIEVSFLGIDCRNRDNPSSWRATFPTLVHYQRAWLEQARRLAAVTEPDRLRKALIDATVLRDIELSEDMALAHKQFDGFVELSDGEREILRWQTLYHCRKVGGHWKIAGFVGYLPSPMGTPEPPKRTTKKLPTGATQHKTAGPYSPVLKVTPRELIVISGQAAIDAEGNVRGDTVPEQAEVTLENCRKQLETAGCSFHEVFKVNVFMTDLAYWSDFNRVYERYMPDPKPVRTVVQTKLLGGLLVEVEMWAAI